MKLLSGIARPDVVVVTNVGVAHMEIFGSWASIVEASAEPVDALGPDGLAILNADDPVAIGYADRCPGRVVTFGARSAADVRAEDVSLDPEGRASFRMAADGAEVRVRLAVPGEHMVSNALAAAAVGRELGISLDDAALALSEAGVSTLAHGDVHDRCGRAGAQRCVQREPRVHRRRPPDRAMDRRGRIA